MNRRSFSQSVKTTLIDYFKDIIYKFLIAPSRSKEFSAEFYNLAKEIRKKSEKDIKTISELAAKFLVNELDKKQKDFNNISDRESESLFKKSIKRAYKKIQR